MYLRTTQRRNRDGSVVKYYQLAHNYRERDTGKCRARVIHNFGRADQLDRDQLVRLCYSIARVCDVQVHDPLAEPLSPEPEDSCEQLPKGLELIATRELGAIVVLEALWERLGLRSILQELCRRNKLRVPYERTLFCMVANRLCEPSSKLGVWDRWLSKVYLPSCSFLKLAQMYEAMDLLAEHAAEVEEMVFFRTANLFNLEVDVVFYDTTSASFCVDSEDEESGEGELNDPALRRWGRNKDGGSFIQVVVALAVTREGLPVRSWVFPGNTTDVTTVEKVRAELRAWKLGRCLFVGDAGMNSEKNRRELARACGKYLLAVRADNAEVRDHVLTRRGRYRKLRDNLRVKEVSVGDGELRRRYLLCHNPKEAQRQKKHREAVLTVLRELMERHPVRHATAKWAAELRASKRYGRYLAVSSGGLLYIDRDKVRAAEKLDGKWVLMTNDDTLSAEDAAEGYKALGVIEDCFRALKTTQIKLRPMFHFLGQRIEAHVKLCVLALLLQRVAERETGESWMRLRQKLSKLQATEFRYSGHQFFQRSEVDGQVRQLLRKLGIGIPKKVLAVESGSGENCKNNWTDREKKPWK